MKKYKLLILTDHQDHSSENSVYPLARAMRQHPACTQVDVATRFNENNRPFFYGGNAEKIEVVTVDDQFEFDEKGHVFQKNRHFEQLDHYDLIWLRLPPPLDFKFTQFLKNKLGDHFIINNPSGIYEAGSKEFLVNFPSVCPPMKVCRSVKDIVEFKQRFPVVLKPFRDYGGKGIVRIDGEKVWEGKDEATFTDFIDKISQSEIAYLGVKFLKNVTEGDKRIIVVNGKILGASLRVPAKGSWLCNVSMGGKSQLTTVDEHERNIVEVVNPTLSKMGIVMYGVDTLMGDDGKRVLSEINSTSIGGLPAAAQQMGLPLIEEAAELIWQYFLDNKPGI